MDEKAAEHPLPDAAPAVLPAERAFVVQFRAQPDGGHLFVGRVEHIASGVACRFSSVEELVSFVDESSGGAVESGRELDTRASWRRLLPQQGPPSAEGWLMFALR